MQKNQVPSDESLEKRKAEGRRHPHRGHKGRDLQRLERLLEQLLSAIRGKKLRRIDQAVGRVLGTDPRLDGHGISVARLCHDYMQFAKGYYHRPEYGGTWEALAIEHAVRPLRELFGRSRAGTFGPRKLRAVRDEMIRRGWCRNGINQNVGRIKRMFKWGVENEMLSATVFHAIQTVGGLRRGRSEARESEPVKPVPEWLLDATLPRLSSPTQAMAKLQLLTGMRPGEVTHMRTCDIDTSVQPWTYRPGHHKTEHFEHLRIVFLGPQAQQIVEPLLRPSSPQDYLFSPQDAEQERRERLHKARKTPMSCGNVPGSNRKRNPKRRPGTHYITPTYAQSVSYACEAAFPPPDGLDEDGRKQWRHEHHWHPHQLRHNVATRLRKEFGLDVAQVVLGHKTLAVTQVYAEKDVEAARKVMCEVG